MLAFFFFFKQKTAYEIYQCDWSSDVCSSDLFRGQAVARALKRLLDSPRVAHHCQTAARRLAADGDTLARASDLIEGLG